MKAYNFNDRVVYKGKEVTIERKETNHSTKKVKYVLDNGKTVTGDELSPVKAKKVVKPIKEVKKLEVNKNNSDGKNSENSEINPK